MFGRSSFNKMDFIECDSKPCYFDDLPEEILSSILQYLPGNNDDNDDDDDDDDDRIVNCNRFSKTGFDQNVTVV